uniref:NB-ARC domain-containing protein n=1 Tax=Oryza barthii TaxID=65489 RepID=A0A0D3HAW1_9ORYZ
MAAGFALNHFQLIIYKGGCSEMGSKLFRELHKKHINTSDGGRVKEFVVFLARCECMCCRLYDAYLYTDNCVFARHVEKQEIINFLLQNPGNQGARLVLPIIGDCRVGKKSLISHVCNDERIRSYFSSILYINGDSSCGSITHAKFKMERTLIVREYFTDIDENDWVNFYSTVSQMTAGGSKVVIIIRIENLARFGTAKAVHLNSLSQEEYSYLFKMLATDQKDHPKMVSVANDLAVVLGGSLITANMISDMLRRNHNVHFWLRILRRFERMVKNNFLKYGEHPKDIIEKEQLVDSTEFMTSYPTHACILVMPPRVERDDIPNYKKPSISFKEVIARSVAISGGDFEIATWESRIPPYTKYVSSATALFHDKNGSTTTTRKRRSTS